EATGAAGFLSDQDEFAFSHCGVDAPLRVLQTAGFIKKVPGGWQCLLFTAYNAQLDSAWIPDETDATWTLFLNGKEKMQTDTSQMLESLPAQSWFSPEGRIEVSAMKEAVLI